MDIQNIPFTFINPPKTSTTEAGAAGRSWSVGDSYGAWAAGRRSLPIEDATKNRRPTNGYLEMANSSSRSHRISMSLLKRT